MRASSAGTLLLGAALLVAGFGVLNGGSPARGAAAQALVGLFDMKERQCARAPSAVGSACPTGCAAMPMASAEDRNAPTECRSPAWLATCGNACAPKAGYARLPDGRLVDGRTLIVTFSGDPDKTAVDVLRSFGATMKPRFDGLDRFDVHLAYGKVTEIKKRLSALPIVVSADFVPR